MEEKWRPCVDVANYEVSSEGRIRNSKTGKILKTQVNEQGYETVSVNRKTKRVHKLVADTFIEGDHDGLDVSHVDRNRLNNRVNNLEYRKRSDIIKQTYEEGREQLHRMKAVRCVETGEEYRSIKECSEAIGISRNSISRCVNNRFLHTRDGKHFEPVE